jgi:hypothetical protein
VSSKSLPALLRNVKKPVETIFFVKNNAISASGGMGADHGKGK